MTLPSMMKHFLLVYCTILANIGQPFSHICVENVLVMLKLDTPFMAGLMHSPLNSWVQLSLLPGTMPGYTTSMI